MTNQSLVSHQQDKNKQQQSTMNEISDKTQIAFLTDESKMSLWENAKRGKKISINAIRVGAPSYVNRFAELKEGDEVEIAGYTFKQMPRNEKDPEAPLYIQRIQEQPNKIPSNYAFKAKRVGEVKTLEENEANELLANPSQVWKVDAVHMQQDGKVFWSLHREDAVMATTP